MIACCVEGPDSVVPRVRYALEELLRGFGRTPVWTRAVDARIYAGPDPENAAPDGLRFRLGVDSTEAILEPGPVETVGWLESQGERVPLPVGPKGRPSSNSRHIIDADVLGSAFWWLTGAQETCANGADKRFAYELSIQSRLDCALLPAVDLYRLWLGDALAAIGESVQLRTWNGHSWAVALTHDIDAVRTHRVRSWIGDTVRGHPLRGLQRLIGPDWRWQSLDALRDVAAARDVGATYFVKGGATTKHDVPYRLDDWAVTAFIRELRDGGFEVGLHPSYGAADDPEHLGLERDRLRTALGSDPEFARMHFLRWSEPDTPAMLREAGFRVDSTLGFSASPGFRRGTCHPFRIYDFAAEQASALWEVPLVLMDATLFEHQKLTTEAAEVLSLSVLAAVRHVGGCAVVLWHNDMGVGREWHKRLGVLDRLIDHAKQKDAAVGGIGQLLDGRD